MKYFLLGLVTFLGCAPMVPPCHPDGTGLVLRGMYRTGHSLPNWNCEVVNEIQDAMTYELRRRFDPRRLDGYELWIMDRSATKDPYGREGIEGYTACHQKAIVVWDTDNPRFGALAHELAHALQNCNAPLPVDPELADHWWGPDHADWVRSGIFTAIARAGFSP